MSKHVCERDGYTQIIEFTPGMRKLVGDAIEALVLLLDEIDDDENLEEEPDLEHGLDDEPSLGSRPGMDQSQWAAIDQGGFCIDAEKEADDEPTMGATENPPSLFFGGPHWHWHVDERCSQLNWAGTTGQPAPDECELDHDNEAEAGTRDLGQGWANNIDQTHLHMIIAEPETHPSRPIPARDPNFPRGLSKGGKRVNLRALRRAKKAGQASAGRFKKG